MFWNDSFPLPNMYECLTSLPDAGDTGKGSCSWSFRRHVNNQVLRAAWKTWPGLWAGLGLKFQLPGLNLGWNVKFHDLGQVTNYWWDLLSRANDNIKSSVIWRLSELLMWSTLRPAGTWQSFGQWWLLFFNGASSDRWNWLSLLISSKVGIVI